MIVYKNDDWIRTVFTFNGSVWPNIKWRLLAWLVYVATTYTASDLLGARFASEGHTILGGAISFLLIFRTNTAYARYWMGRGCVSIFFDDLRDLLMVSLLYVSGGPTYGLSSKESNVQVNARKLQVNMVRLTMALAVILKTYTRIGLEGYIFGSISKETKWCVDWDRYSLMQLLDSTEFEFVDKRLGIIGPGKPMLTSKHELAEQFRHGDGPPESWPDEFQVSTEQAARMHVAVVYFLREQIVSNMNDFQNACPWGIKERFVPILSKLLSSAQSAFEMVGQIVTTPLPLPYACLCKVLLTIWMLSYPFVFDYRRGLFGGAVIPTLVAFALLGIDAIATELENPFGYDANDIDLIEQIHTLEGEAMEMLDLYGDDSARSHFVWRRLPAFVAETSCKPVYHFLAVTEYANHEVVPSSVKSSRAGLSERSGSSASGSRSSLGSRSEDL